MRKDQLLPTPDSAPQFRVGRRTALRAGVGVAASGGKLLANAAEALAAPKPIVPEYVHAIEGAEYPLQDARGVTIGMFYTQTGDQKLTGFSVQDQGELKFYSAFKRLGGINVLGYPVSKPFLKDEFMYQVLQGGVLQYNPREGSPDGAVLANIFDKQGGMLADIEEKNRALAENFRARGIPTHLDGGYGPEERLTWLDPNNYPDQKLKTAIIAIRDAFTNIGGRRVSMQEAALTKGYPTSKPEDFGLYTGMRFQRRAEQYWQEELPNHPELPRRGSVTPFLGGALLIEAGWVQDSNALELERYAQGGGTTPEPTRTNSPLEFPVVQQGRGQQTSWETQKAPNSPITPTVLRPDALVKATDTWLPKGGITEFKIKTLPVFEGFNYPGIQPRFRGQPASLTGNSQGPEVDFKYTKVIEENKLVIYIAPADKDSFNKLYSMPNGPENVGRNISHLIGNLIAETGGFNFNSSGIVQEAKAMSDSSLPPAVLIS